LNARVELHRRFSLNRGSFNRWVFDQLELPEYAQVFEVGCGPGHLWAANADRVSSGWSAVLTDFSLGMVAIARSRLGDRFRYAVADAEALPHPPGAFHGAIANHMLYHVPNRAHAIRELARVLQPDGVLYAVTNGGDHLREIDNLIAQWLPAGPIARHSAQFGVASSFKLENGAQQLRAGFANIELRRWEDALEITEAEPVVAYVRSMSVGSLVDLEGLRREAVCMIEREGMIHVRKATGLFIARGPIPSRS
jgi:ubiquinone/menaquinone biosynthesis C-methylase UbiE